MNGFMAASGPAGAPGDIAGVVITKMHDLVRRSGQRIGLPRTLLLEMALVAERSIALQEHAWVDGAVRIVAHGAAFTQSLMLKHKRSTLGRMAAEADLIGVHQRGSTALLGAPLMRIMAIRAAHLAGKNRVRVRQIEFCANLQMALEAGLRLLARIQDRAISPAGGNVFASRTVARFAANVLGVLSMSLQPSVSGSRKIFGERFVAVSAGF